jgi:tellurite resistance protein TerC
MSPPALGALLVTLGLLLLADVLLFARGREPGFRESAVWSVGWLLLGFGATLPIAALSDGERGLNYLTVYLIERSLSLDNLFVFLLIFAYFGVPEAHRGRLILYGIVLAAVTRGAAIVVGVELIERFHFVLYALGAMLLYLAYRC